jgi:altronate hydrolase
VVPLRDAAIHLHASDNVAIARTDLPAGISLAVGLAVPPDSLVSLRQSIPSGHKVALGHIDAGEPIRRYGQVIGFARVAILPGEHVHTHNVDLDDVARDAATSERVAPVSALPEAERQIFLGYRRPDGRVGTRNYIAVISTVNCSAHTARAIAHHFAAEHLAPFSNVDGVIALTHQSGCPMRYALLQRTLAGMARHPNVGAYVLVGLGCETNHVAELVESYDLRGETARSLVITDRGGIQPTVKAGIAAVRELLPVANAARRSAQPLSELTLALQCGGSDSWSGVTANPVVGLVADEVVRQGGRVVLAETPEIYGAEHLLTRRTVNAQVSKDLLTQVRWWRAYARTLGLQVDDNRTVGNEAGGLTTIYEKSLGAVAKAGTSPLVAVYDYAKPVTARGFCFMNSPGFDPVSVTGQVAGGCNLVLFTTGRGSVFGFKPAPSIKISSNSALYQRMRGDVDLNAGQVLEGVDPEAVAADLFDLVVAVASGQPSKSEAQSVGDAEFCPWNREGTL